ncbi:chemotaxis protein CheA [Desulfonatronum lacustre]|uniref:chemotaxis protein CheA n=1 Tax=Desulfonatronum lacustre TaxID=66849 RepID=UPI00048C4B37|nr:chemotaxis protein CheA [Desulfonatronum lacustre]SMP76870.1 CheA signal transduction histidine kinase [Desulfonatronum zhilinae]
MSRDEQMQQAKEAYLEEARELLGDLEDALLELESDPEDRELINRVFRSMHTIKGSGAMFGFDDIAMFTHELETVFDLVRNDELRVTSELLDLTLKSRDLILEMLHQDGCHASTCQGESERIVARLRGFLTQAGKGPTGSTADETDVEGPEASGSTDELSTVYRISFKPDARIFLTGTNPLALLEELAELGNCKIVARTENIPRLEEMDPVSCYTWWDMILVTSRGREAIHDVFIFVEDDCELTIQEVETVNPDDVTHVGKRLGEILVERGDVNIQDLKAILKQQRPLGELLTQAGLVSSQGLEAALTEQEVMRDVRAPRMEHKEAVTSIRVEAAKLDKLGDLVGELVIVQARLTQLVTQRHDPALASLAEELERLSDELRDNTLGIRMLPIGSTFNKFLRLVRDLSKELGKEIELVTQGGETELDKNVIEKLNDPMVHLLRNSIDHGVESPQARQAKGKSRKGRITLSAEHASGEVLIRIMDDGAGIEPARIRAKALEKGLITADSALSDDEVLQLVFLPGFSTAEQVSNVSGRGVGMDVVKRGIDALRGVIKLESVPNKGTSVLIKLPLTLAIIDGLQVEVAQEQYVIPLSSVEECVELDRFKSNFGENGEMINLRGEAVPFIRLRNWFDQQGALQAIEQVVVVNVQEQRVGLVVDKVIGQHQTVIKSLGRVYRELDGISGATINGDGTMALILDVQALIGAAVRNAVQCEGTQPI